QDRWRGTACVRTPSACPGLSPHRIVHLRCFHDESPLACVDFIHGIGSERVNALNPSNLAAKLTRHEGRDHRLFAVSENPAFTHYILWPDSNLSQLLALAMHRRAYRLNSSVVVFLPFFGTHFHQPAVPHQPKLS